MDSPTTPGQIVGRNVRALRGERLLSQRELAERSGVAKITIATMELGRSAHPRRRTVEKLARALGVPAEDLIHPKEQGGASPEQPPLNGFEDARREPVLISAASGAGGGAAARVRVGVDELFNALVADLRKGRLSEARLEQARGEVRRLVGVG